MHSEPMVGTLRAMVATQTSAPRASASAEPRERHGSIGGNALRASVLGANDGLVSNLSLVMGVAGAGLENRVILITGLAGLLAGACSMAMGEWISVQSSRELFQRELAVERAEIAHYPEEEHDELVGIYEARGLSRAAATELATHVMADDDRALEVMAREELGIDPQGLGGSAWTAAISSFALFVAGAMIPVAPFAFLSAGSAVWTSLVASTVGLFGIGAAITRVTARSAWRSGTRQLAIGLAAAAVTYGTGVLLGVSVGL
jgi:VIT1/CCC1 family predicted Fe2+/Mn2+ transporter